MKWLLPCSVLCLAAAGAVWFAPVASSTGPETPPPLSLDRLAISPDDSGTLAAIKFQALEAAANGREATLFAARLRTNPTEFAGPAPALAAWRDTIQDVRRVNQQGLANRFEQLQDSPEGWATAFAGYFEEAGRGWTASAAELAKLAQSQEK